MNKIKMILSESLQVKALLLAIRAAELIHFLQLFSHADSNLNGTLNRAE